MTYTLTAHPNTIVRDADQAHIPNDLANVDWQHYQAWLSAGNTPNPYAPPPPTKQQEANAHLAGGLTVTSGDNSSLNGTFGVTADDNHNMNAIVTSLANGTGLPLGLDQVAVFDKSGARHRLRGTKSVGSLSPFGILFTTPASTGKAKRRVCPQTRWRSTPSTADRAARRARRGQRGRQGLRARQDHRGRPSGPAQQAPPERRAPRDRRAQRDRKVQLAQRDYRAPWTDGSQRRCGERR